MQNIKKCQWCLGDTLLEEYHDHIWGVPCHEDKTLFEFLCLEGMQAGLSWLTVLKKRKGYLKAFCNFEITKVARLSDAYLEQQLQNSNIIRNRLKVFAIRKNAIAAENIIAEFGSLNNYFWGYIGYKPIKNKFKTLLDLPAETELSKQISKDLKKRGMSFIGATIIYAFMQAVGMVNDHQTNCFRYHIV